MSFTIGQLRKVLRARKATWAPHAKLKNSDRGRQFALGGTKEGLPLSTKSPNIDFRAILERPTNNPFLLHHRMLRGILPAEMAPSSSLPPAGGVGSTVVDWRNRWGLPWVTSVRDQNPCQACWAFAATALVESMTRIEHAVWTTRSEGDVHKGMGAKCANLGNSAAALDWIKQNGIADPGCFAWTSADVAYTPTPDRSGRTVKVPEKQFIGSVADQKAWLDTVGPLVSWFEVYFDFQQYGSGVYHKMATIGGSPNPDLGGHYFLIVGYDDNQRCWIVKNSWGTAWGQSGFALVGYGECDIDKYSKIGLQLTNPDPWTKRRVHNGNMIESGNGAMHRNFEMLATANGSQVRHWWRDNSAAGFPWHAASVFANDAAACPTLTGTTFNRNFEAVYLTTRNRLHHWFFDQAAQDWVDGGVFGPADAYGIPGFIQSNYGAPGNFEVVVRTRDGRLNHWWRINGAPWTWNDGGRFGSNVALSGPSLVQSHYGVQGNFELVAVLNNGQMQHWWRDNDRGNVWHPGRTFGTGVFSPPCMIEGQFGAGDEKRVGNFELCVAVGGQVQHWWRNNQGDMAWRQSTIFGHDVAAVAGLVEGSYGFNLEVIVLRYDRMLQHYWRAGAFWYEGPVIGSAA